MVASGRWLSLVFLVWSLAAVACPSGSVRAQAGSLESWRAGFRGADTKAGEMAFKAQMSSAIVAMPENAVAQGFHAVAELLHEVGRPSPWSKWFGFRKWTGELEAAIAESESDPDLRFLRLTVQNGAPGFLRYRGQMASDCSAVADALKDGFWDADPAHLAFVTRIHTEIEACRL